MKVMWLELSSTARTKCMAFSSGTDASIFQSMIQMESAPRRPTESTTVVTSSGSTSTRLETPTDSSALHGRRGTTDNTTTSERGDVPDPLLEAPSSDRRLAGHGRYGLGRGTAFTDRRAFRVDVMSVELYAWGVDL